MGTILMHRHLHTHSQKQHVKQDKGSVRDPQRQACTHHPNLYAEISNFKNNLKCEQFMNEEARLPLEQRPTPGLGRESRLMEEEREAGMEN